MPWKSDAQRRWGNSPAGRKAMGTGKVAEFNAATKGRDLPEKIKPARKAALERMVKQDRKGE